MGLAAGKTLSQMACHIYQIEDISVISWLYILLDRMKIQVEQDIHVSTTWATGEVTMTIVLKFPHYDTWVQFDACIGGQRIKHEAAFGDEEYGQPRPPKPSAPLLAPIA